MRRIETAEEKERRRKRNVSILSIVMLVVLLFGTLGYAFSFALGGGQSSNPIIPDAGFDNGYWTAVVGGQELYFIYSPESISDVSVSVSKTINDYAGDVVYLSVEDNGVFTELQQTLGKFASRVQQACYGDCDEDLSVKDCSDNLIVLNSDSYGRVYEEENCVFIEGGIRETDAFLHKVFQLN